MSRLLQDEIVLSLGSQECGKQLRYLHFLDSSEVPRDDPQMVAAWNAVRHCMKGSEVDQKNNNIAKQRQLNGPCAEPFRLASAVEEAMLESPTMDNQLLQKYSEHFSSFIECMYEKRDVYRALNAESRRRDILSNYNSK